MAAAFAFRSELRNFLPGIFGRSRVRDDIIQEAMLRAFLFWSSGKPIKDLKRFLIATARRISIDVWRSENSIPFVPLKRIESSDDGDVEELSGIAPWNADPARLVEYEEEFERHRRILLRRKNKMPQRMRQVYELRAHGLSQRETAARLQISENTVEQHLMHAYRLVRGEGYSTPPLTALFRDPEHSR